MLPINDFHSLAFFYHLFHSYSLAQFTGRYDFKNKKKNKFLYRITFRNTYHSHIYYGNKTGIVGVALSDHYNCVL